MRRYPTEHNERWGRLRHRPGDVVISTRSKCGTTWLQMIVAVLVLGPELPAPLAELSPWLDWEVEPLDVVLARLEAQDHRRLIKTHTPLDGLPLDPRVHYLVAGRRPLDVAVSQYHHSRNIDRERFAELTGRPVERSPVEPFDEWVDGWLRDDWRSTDRLDSLSGLVHHVDDAWRRTDQVDVRLVHFDDLVADLESEMRSIASWLGIEVEAAAWPDLVVAARIDSMRDRAASTVPDRLGVLRSTDAFFRGGRVGDGAAAVPALVVEVEERVRWTASPDAASWLLR